MPLISLIQCNDFSCGIIQPEVKKKMDSFKIQIEIQNCKLRNKDFKIRSVVPI